MTRIGNEYRGEMRGAVSPGGRFALLLEGSSWLLWDATAGRPARVGVLAGRAPPPSALALSEDGRALVVGGADGVVAEFELSSGRATWSETACAGPVAAVTVSGGRVIALAADGTLWNRGRPEGRRAAGRIARVVAVAGAVAAAAGWLPAVVLAGLAVWGGASRRIRFQLSLSERGVSRG